MKLSAHCFPVNKNFISFEIVLFFMFSSCFVVRFFSLSAGQFRYIFPVTPLLVFLPIVYHTQKNLSTLPSIFPEKKRFEEKAADFAPRPNSGTSRKSLKNPDFPRRAGFRKAKSCPSGEVLEVLRDFFQEVPEWGAGQSPATLFS